MTNRKAQSGVSLAAPRPGSGANLAELALRARRATVAEDLARLERPATVGDLENVNARLDAIDLKLSEVVNTKRGAPADKIDRVLRDYQALAISLVAKMPVTEEQRHKFQREMKRALSAIMRDAGKHVSPEAEKQAERRYRQRREG